MRYIADLPRDLGVFIPFSDPFKLPAVLGASDVIGVLGRMVVLFSNTESCLGAWLPSISVDGDTLEGLVHM